MTEKETYIEGLGSIRKDKPPKKTGIGYKIFYLKDGKLYPPVIANPNGKDTPIGVWLDADAAPVAGKSKTGRNQVKSGGKGTARNIGLLAYRPGWHLGEIPYALQFNKKDEKGEKTLFPKEFVWAICEYAADVDYQKEAMSYGFTANGKFNHAYAGLPYVPKNGFYRYRTNPNPETDPWIITGAMKVVRVLTKAEVDRLVRKAGRKPQKLGDIYSDIYGFRDGGNDDDLFKLLTTIFNGNCGRAYNLIEAIEQEFGGEIIEISNGALLALKESHIPIAKKERNYKFTEYHHFRIKRFDNGEEEVIAINFEPNKKLSGVLGQIYDEYIKQNLSLEDARKLQVKINAEYQKYKNHPTKSNKYLTRSVAIKAYIDYLLTNLSGFSATPDTFDIEYRTIPQATIDRYADILAQKEDWQNFYHWYFFIQKPLKFKDGTFKEGFIETSFDTYLKKNEIGSSQVRLFVKRVTNLFNFICDKCCIRYHTYRVRYEDHGIFKYLNSNRKGTGGTMMLCFDYSENAIFKKAVTMFLALLNANMDDGGNDGVVLYNYKAFKDAEYCTFEKSNQEMPSNTTFKIGSLIRYKDSDGTIYKIVDTTDKGYVVLDLSMPEPFRQRNVIPFANNNQLVEFPILFYNEIEYAKIVSKQHLNGICGIPDTDKYLACLAEHEDWHRCIVDDYTFIDKPNKSKKVSHGYIQRQAKAENKADGERFCEETEQLFSIIISLFPGWATPDPIIRYTPKQGLYYRQLRFTYDENDKFLQVIPEFLAMINADMSKFEFVFDKFSAAKSKCCKFEYSKTTTKIPLPEQEQKRTSPFKFDYDSHISAFIKTLDSQQAKKTLPNRIKKDFDKFYQDLFHYTDDLDDIRWIAENNNGWTFVEDNIMGGLTREIYDYLLQDPKTGDYSYNRLQLAKIYYQRLCAECGVTPSATFYEVFYPLFTNEIEYSKIKAKK